MELSTIIDNLEQLSIKIKNWQAKEFDNTYPSIKAENAWFTKDNITLALTGIQAFLDKDKLKTWVEKYHLNENQSPKSIGIVMAGNIPLVGFHDLLTVLITGNIAFVKPSSNDNFLMLWIIQSLLAINPALKNQIKIIDKIKNVDAVIATGSNNTSRYFEYYFRDIPHIIRKNRNSIAIINGNESIEDFIPLSKDIFSYFGLGCRNVSKLYVPKGYNFDPFFQAMENTKQVINHHKYNNNYEYNRAIFVLKTLKHFDNGFLLLREDSVIASPIATLHYEHYNKVEDLEKEFTVKKQDIQCMVSNKGGYPNSFAFGEAQKPQLWDYADDIDTVNFLINL